MLVDEYIVRESLFGVFLEARNTARAIRQELKERFPCVRFTVTPLARALDTHVQVTWSDGPEQEEIRSVLCKYQYGRYDGYRGTYACSTVIHSLPQVKYVCVKRTVTESLLQRAKVKCRKFLCDLITQSKG
jgi:hypothetical protein